ncbi:MAG: hypothetical protein ACTS3F_02345 [Phycisphaerales bacterium]
MTPRPGPQKRGLSVDSEVSGRSPVRPESNRHGDSGLDRSDILGFDKTYRDAARSISTVLIHAAQQSLDVTILAGSLRDPFRGRAFEEMTGQPFDLLLRNVLNSNGIIRILLWNEQQSGLITESVVRLMEDRNNVQDWGDRPLDIRLSGTCEHHDRLAHFVCAHPRHRHLIDESSNVADVVIRIEQPHSVAALRSTVDPNSPAPPAILCAGRTARHFAAPIIRQFDALFNAIPRPTQDNQEVNDLDGSGISGSRGYSMPRVVLARNIMQVRS